jgi:4-hydroxy-tetrahydrodipicolinate reductase
VDAPAETLELRHLARSAAAFAEGALAAAHWIVGRRGVHTMDEVASAALDPLFAGLQGGGR